MTARTDIFERWGTFTRTMVSMFELTIGNWGPLCWMLTNLVDERWALFVLVYKLTIGFAVMQVIMSVFIQQTFKVAACDEEVMINEKKALQHATYNNLEKLFNVLDTSRDGILSREEFNGLVADARLGYWFAALNIELGDVEELFHIMDVDDDGALSKVEFMEGVKTLSGTARNKDMFLMRRDIIRISVGVSDAQRKLACLAAVIARGRSESRVVSL
eukprot:NODE_16575_length_987_cov_4.647674.p1 GENE.NODE_16575_length_987_cov_4.647674~~NODE_16575_length_987_cov_4.647674.p1  ORF type:complete len:217 (+),score=52.73 NODE_16575_length_987_cov_4.647674:296-946(+)